MYQKLSFAALSGLILIAVASSTGCISSNWTGQSLGMFGVVPVTPFIQDRMEDNYIRRERFPGAHSRPDHARHSRVAN